MDAGILEADVGGETPGLFSKMLPNLDVTDKRRVEDIASVFKAEQLDARCRTFPRQVKRPTLTQDPLCKSTSFSSNKVVKQLRLRQETELELDTWRITNPAS